MILLVQARYTAQSVVRKCTANGRFDGVNREASGLIDAGTEADDENRCSQILIQWLPPVYV